MNHLTDDEIQEYLDKSSDENVKNISEHIKICPTCRQQVEVYKNVYSSIKTEPNFSTPINFTESIIAKIESSEDRKYKKWETILLFFTIIQGFGLAFYFIDFKKLISNITLGNPNIFLTITKKFNEFEPGIFPIILFAVIIIGFFAFLDRILGHIKKSGMISLV